MTVITTWIKSARDSLQTKESFDEVFPHTHIIPYQQVKPPELKSRLDPLIRRLCQPGLTNPGLTKRVRSHPLKQNILPRQNIDTKILKHLQIVLTIIIGYF